MTKNINEIFKRIFAPVADKRRYSGSTTNVEAIQLVNPELKLLRETENFDAFEKLVLLLLNKNTESSHKVKCNVVDHDSVEIMPHTWFVKDNYFYVFVHPYIHKNYYEMVSQSTDFNRFFITNNKRDFGNYSKKSKDYYYWPNVTISYYGWRHYLLMKYNIDIGDSIPLIHHKNLGNVNLFVFNPEDFINVELSLRNKENKQILFVNGRSVFNDTDDVLFEVTMTDNSQVLCQVKDNLVFSNKNFFNYLRDDINLLSCKTSLKYVKYIDIDLEALRLFKKTSFINKNKEAVTVVDKIKVFKNITASSEISKWFEKELASNLQLVNEAMVEVLVKTDNSDENVLCNYFYESDFMNFDYIIFVLWQKLNSHKDAEIFSKTDIKLFLEYLVEFVFHEYPDRSERARQRCEPYNKLSPKVFTRLCNHWTIFAGEEPCISLGHYYAIHVLINRNTNTWDYTFANVRKCDTDINLEMSGFVKKLITNSAQFIFNGTNYIVLKDKDEGWKQYARAQGGVSVPSVKFNNWKYLYFTEEGVYNLIINDYHSSCPFFLGNTLIKSLTRKNENVYVPERIVQYMLDNGKFENDIYRVYHMAKVCRDIRMLKNNMYIISSLNNCISCKRQEQLKLNDIFREIWNSNDIELVGIGLYLNAKKVSDLIENFKCGDCQMYQIYQKQTNVHCDCLKLMKINHRAFKIAIITQLFSKSEELIELIWSLLYMNNVYCRVLMERLLDGSSLIEKYGKFVYDNRTEVITYMYNFIDRLDFVDTLLYSMSNAEEFLKKVEKAIRKHKGALPFNKKYEYSQEHNHSDDFVSDEETTEKPKNKKKKTAHSNNHNEDDGFVEGFREKFEEYKQTNFEDNENKEDDDDDDDNNEAQICKTIEDFFQHYQFTTNLLNKWPVWWDKLIVKRPTDDLNTWLIRFYMRTFMTNLDLSQYSSLFIKQLVQGYLYFRGFTNFNYTNSKLMIHFGASMGIPSDYEKCCIYLNGKPGSGKSSFFELLEHIIVVHKHDSEKYTLSKKDTNEMEADKMISQLYVINEMKVCDDSFFKATADSTKSNSVCRKYQGSQKYEANYKLLIVNNKPLHITNYDKGVRNRFAIVYTDHLFEENLPFNGSIYWHIKNKLFPMEKNYIEGLAKPVRLFLSHILMYNRNSKDGYVSYKNIIKHDPIHNHNLMCLDINNSPLNALLYVLKVQVQPGARLISEEKLALIIEAAVPQVDSMLHSILTSNRNNVNNNMKWTLLSAFKRKFKKYYREDDKCFFSINLARRLEDFNTTRPEFQC